MDPTPFLEPTIPVKAIFNRLEKMSETTTARTIWHPSPLRTTTHKEISRTSLPNDPENTPRFFVQGQDGSWQPISWERYGSEIQCLTEFLVSRGLEPAERACIFAPNRVEWATAAMAIQAAGGVIVPIYGSCTSEQAGYVIEHSDATTIFVDSVPLLLRLFAVWRKLENVRTIVVLDSNLDVVDIAHHAGEAGIDIPPPSWLSERFVRYSTALSVGKQHFDADRDRFSARIESIGLEHTGMMLYTSGTSGPPKGVPLTHANVAANGHDWLVCNAPLLEEGYVDLLWLPMSHIFGFGAIAIGNTLGFTTYLTDPSSALSLLPTVRPHVFMSVPAYWEKLATMATRHSEPTQALAALTGGRLRFCLSGGAGLKREVKELFHGAGLLLVEGYGLTEASPTLTLNRPDAFRFDSVGKPLPSVELRLAEDGEILARGPNVFAGYHKDPDATKAAFTPDGWLKTGDIGRFTDDGFLQIVDRKKDILVTSGGKNIPPANIELMFQNDAVIRFAVVYGDGKSYLVLGVWIDQDAMSAQLKQMALPDNAESRDKIIQERIDRVNVQLARHETIKKFKIMQPDLTAESGFITPTLKIKRKQIYDAFRKQFEELYGG
ncbi:MAG: long-chain fatty acid--CoA ligase [Myxococcales bacterium]|nr:long-chain fatty acid--CoA ligase [Myxococcales bacterium]